MEIRHAQIEDIPTYVELGREAQAWLQSRGLRQYVPAAHEEYAAAIRVRVESKTLYAVWSDQVAVGFFSLDTIASDWWPVDDAAALYVAGIVVAQAARGRGVGDHILRWCITETGRLKRKALRLDCHAENRWLCQYYEARGFRLRGQIEQHAGYNGCLFELAVSNETHAS